MPGADAASASARCEPNWLDGNRSDQWRMNACSINLVSAADCWRVHLRAAPGWHRYGEPDEDGGRSVREVVSVSAEDDLGGTYISQLGGSRHIRRRGRERLDHEEQVLRFHPRRDPLAGVLHLTFRGAAEEILIGLDLG